MTTAQSKKQARRDILVIGGGRFGRLALERLPDRVSTVVEPKPDEALLALAHEQGVNLVQASGVDFLAPALAADQPPAWVVPALPRHLLHDWLLRELAPLGARAVEVPQEVLPPAASVFRGEEGQLFVSLADFLCPDDCPEPPKLCTVTGKPRGEPLYQRLAGMSPTGWQVAVLRSRQLAPGVGGCLPGEMLQIKYNIEALGGDWLVATSCRCHGVVSGLSLPEKPQHE
ncbi:MAG: NAD-binding protein [Proteobacteria bacterium]|nr:NAD-binding protein [Pseudomonadota bacterium]MBU4277935.1 NAD-binding protein [Pseudomonadota bacterium]MBU4384981.1 NAD-binding protein [Pseudomonadota bacterium]MBU4603682.1 NAD-binding protein [Pseudomonadota bacterium]MCG2766116.1 NAD-binding protein [Desulfarculaceae bacterium]